MQVSSSMNMWSLGALSSNKVLPAVAMYPWISSYTPSCTRSVHSTHPHFNAKQAPPFQLGGDARQKGKVGRYCQDSYSPLTVKEDESQKFHSALGYVCSLHPKKIFLAVETFQQKSSHVHLDNLCTFIKFREIPIFFMVDVKRIKHLS
jgi:hypothetical protein